MQGFISFLRVLEKLLIFVAVVAFAVWAFAILKSFFAHLKLLKAMKKELAEGDWEYVTAKVTNTAIEREKSVSVVNIPMEYTVLGQSYEKDVALYLPTPHYNHRKGDEITMIYNKDNPSIAYFEDKSEIEAVKCAVKYDFAYMFIWFITALISFFAINGCL